MEPFKNLFNKNVVKRIATAINSHYPDFNTTSFLKNSESELAPLELKARVIFLAEKLSRHLPADPTISIPLLVKSLKQNDKDKMGLDGFSVWPLTHYVSVFGIDHFELSMNALKEMTKVFTGEFAVRAFFMTEEKKALKYFKECLKDENEHVRRWASEGSRPLLPWGQKLHSFVLDPERTWDILEKLKNDPSEYVRKSVANHINDHSKNHPDFVIEKLLLWHHSKNKSPELTWVIKHASRSLIKKGFKKAFLLHGVEATNISVKQSVLTKKMKINEKLVVKITLLNLNNKPAQIILDHEIHLLKANSNHSIKVFKGKKLSLKAKEEIELELSIPIKAVTTRVYYSGEHHYNCKINGVAQKPESFFLKV